MSTLKGNLWCYIHNEALGLKIYTAYKELKEFSTFMNSFMIEVNFCIHCDRYSKWYIHPIKYVEDCIALGFLWLYYHSGLKHHWIHMFSLPISVRVTSGYFTDTGAIIWLPQCQWSNPEWYGYAGLVSYHSMSQEVMNCVNNSWDVLAVLALFNTLRPRQNGGHFTTFPNAFPLMKIYEFWLMFQWSLFLRIKLTIFQH